jgi:hypothetical protein
VHAETVGQLELKVPSYTVTVTGCDKCGQETGGGDGSGVDSAWCYSMLIVPGVTAYYKPISVEHH